MVKHRFQKNSVHSSQEINGCLLSAISKSGHFKSKLSKFDRFLIGPQTYRFNTFKIQKLYSMNFAVLINLNYCGVHNVDCFSQHQVIISPAVPSCWCYDKIFTHRKLTIFQHKKCRVRNCDLTLFIKIFIWTNDSPLFYWPDFTWNESFLNVNDSRTVIKTGQLLSEDMTAKKAYGKW